MSIPRCTHRNPEAAGHFLITSSTCIAVGTAKSVSGISKCVFGVMQNKPEMVEEGNRDLRIGGMGILLGASLIYFQKLATGCTWRELL